MRVGDCSSCHSSVAEQWHPKAVVPGFDSRWLPAFSLSSIFETSESLYTRLLFITIKWVVSIGLCACSFLYNFLVAGYDLVNMHRSLYM